MRMLHRRRRRIGLAARATAWLVAFALAVQTMFVAGAAMGMWLEAHAPGTTAAAPCPEHARPAHRDRDSNHGGHDHEHCLLCNTNVGDCPVPVVPLVSRVPERAVEPAVAPARIAFRRLVHANAPRGPPRPA